MFTTVPPYDEPSDGDTALGMSSSPMNSTALSCITCSLFSMHKPDKHIVSAAPLTTLSPSLYKVGISQRVIAEETAIDGTIVCKSHDAVVCDPPELITHDVDSSMPPEREIINRTSPGYTSLRCARRWTKTTGAASMMLIWLSSCSIEAPLEGIVAL